jgi:uncharacterized protein YunC (DUF1805 family)
MEPTNKVIPPLSIHMGNQNYLKIKEYKGFSYLNLEKCDERGERKFGVTYVLSTIDNLRAAVEVAKKHIEKHLE